MIGFPRTVDEQAARTVAGVVAVTGLIALLVPARSLAAATLESVLAFCAGCQVFALLMRAGMIPEAICAECADIRARRPA